MRNKNPKKKINVLVSLDNKTNNALKIDAAIKGTTKYKLVESIIYEYASKLPDPLTIKNKIK